MTDHDREEEDQIARAGNELREGVWLANARNRSRRRKSAWNLLLPLFGLPLCAAFIALLMRLGHVIHAAFHPDQAHAISTHGAMSVGDTLVSVASLIAAIAPAMLVTNFLVYRIAPARRAMEAEDRNFRAVGYKSSQRALFKGGLPVLAVGLLFILLGAALK